ncbi:MAG: hypothetical protein AAF456_17860 [Planctomycetota bacterium]
MTRLSVILIAIFCSCSAGCHYRNTPAANTWVVQSGSYTARSYPASQIVETPYPNMTRPYMPFLRALGAPAYDNPVAQPLDQPCTQPARRSWFSGGGPKGYPFANLFARKQSAEPELCVPCEPGLEYQSQVQMMQGNPGHLNAAGPEFRQPGPGEYPTSEFPASEYPTSEYPTGGTYDPSPVIHGPGFGETSPQEDDWVDRHAELARVIEEIANDQAVVR